MKKLKTRVRIFRSMSDDDLQAIGQLLSLLTNSLKDRPSLGLAVAKAVEDFNSARVKHQSNDAKRLLNALFQPAEVLQMARFQVLSLGIMLSEVSVRWLAVYGGTVVLFQSMLSRPDAQRGEVMLDILQRLLKSEAAMVRTIGTGTMPWSIDLPSKSHANPWWMCLDQMIAHVDEEQCLICFGMNRTGLLNMIEAIHEQQSCFTRAMGVIKIQLASFDMQIEAECIGNLTVTAKKSSGGKGSKKATAEHTADVARRMRHVEELCQGAEFQELQSTLASLWRASTSFLQLAGELGAQFASVRKQKLAAAYEALSKSKQNGRLVLEKH